MDKNSTELVFIIDKSGSMSGLEKDTIGGFNSTIEKQKKIEGEAFVTTVLFSTEFDTIHDRIPLRSVKPLSEDDYFASGGTALLDAVGNAIQRIAEVHSHTVEGDVPAKTMFVIITDGYENSSREFTYSKLKSLIDKKTEEGWEFIFLGANIDVAKEASKMGIREDRCANYECDEYGLECCYEIIDRSVCAMRTNGNIGSLRSDGTDD